MPSGKKLSHLGRDKEATMVAIDHKQATRRIAVAECVVRLPSELEQVLEENELYMPKGAVFETARIAGIMAVKKTSELIPLCHPILIEKCNLHFQLEHEGKVLIRCTVGTSGKTGVEMEALTGADRKSVGEGKRVSGRVDLGGRRIYKKKKKKKE